MKAMITGLTPGHTAPMEQLKICNLSQTSREVLMEHGWEVEQKVVSPEDDVTDYDLLIYGVSSITSMYVAKRIWSLYFLWKALDEGVPVLISINDWHVYDTYAGFRWYFNNQDRWAEKANRLNWVHKDFMIDHQDEYYEMIDMFHNGPWPLTMATFFPWGDRERFVKKGGLTVDRIRGIDLTARQPYHDQPWVKPKDRLRKWILASMGDHSKWANDQGGSWGYHSYGHRRTQQPRLTEPEVVRLYSKYWGVMNFGYAVSGSGWWRNRYGYAARSLSVLYGDEKELEYLGEPYSHSIEHIEGLNDRGLMSLARAQRDLFFTSIWTDNALTLEFMNVVQETISGKERTTPRLWTNYVSDEVLFIDKPVKPTKALLNEIASNVVTDEQEAERRVKSKAKKKAQKEARAAKKAAKEAEGV